MHDLKQVIYLLYHTYTTSLQSFASYLISSESEREKMHVRFLCATARIFALRQSASNFAEETKTQPSVTSSSSHLLILALPAPPKARIDSFPHITIASYRHHNPRLPKSVDSICHLPYHSPVWWSDYASAVKAHATILSTTSLPSMIPNLVMLARSKSWGSTILFLDRLLRLLAFRRLLSAQPQERESYQVMGH